MHKNGGSEVPKPMPYGHRGNGKKPDWDPNTGKVYKINLVKICTM
jgi:hypothetical protein